MASCGQNDGNDKKPNAFSYDDYIKQCMKNHLKKKNVSPQKLDMDTY